MKLRQIVVVLILVASLQGLAQSQGLAHGQNNPAAATASNPTIENARQARALVDQCIQALGGPAYLNFVDMRQEGRGYGFSHNASVGVGAVFVRSYRYPDKERIQFFKTREWVIVHNGDKGFETTYHGSKAEDPKDLDAYLRRNEYALDRVLREWVSAGGTAFFYEGTTIAEARQVHQVTLVNAENQSVTLFVDVKSLLPVKKSYHYRDEEKMLVEEAELYDKYRLVQGIQTPHMITRMTNGEMSGQRFLKSVSFNLNFPDSTFAPPVVDQDWGRKKR